MEMRAIEAIAIAQDLTPPLPPLASALHDPSLKSHCSTCFSPLLPQQPFPPLTPAVHYCSPRCSSLDSALHISSAETQLLSLFRDSPPSTWDDSSDLRLALRLLHIFRKLPQNSWVSPRSSRLAGLITNRERLMFREKKGNSIKISEDQCENRGCAGNGKITEGYDEVQSLLQRIRDGAKAMAVSRTMCAGDDVNLDSLEEEEFVVEEMVLCLVLTNAVEVQDKSGCCIGIAVYGTNFSWINHSCTPNACYRFSMALEHNEQPPLSISPAATKNSCGDDHVDDVIVEGESNALLSGMYGYGPRVIVRSIKALSKGEEVSIAYTDLLQPKEIRQAELWLKYKFKCQCSRCNAHPATYVDCSLQDICTTILDSPGIIPARNLCAEDEIKKLVEDFDNAIADYLTLNNPESCCEKLENLLTHGHVNSVLYVQPKTLQSQQNLKLHLFHHVSLNAYTTLSSAYKVCASNLLALNPNTSEHKLQAFKMHKLSAAYSLLLAGVSQHLFMFESSLVATAANFWINAGESLLSLVDLELSPSIGDKCGDCILEPNSIDGCCQDVQLEELNKQQLNCTVNISSRVWDTLSSGSSFLKLIQNPFDFGWVKSAESLTISKVHSRGNEFKQVRRDVILLSSHCLRYGAFLSNICYGVPFLAFGLN